MPSQSPPFREARTLTILLLPEDWERIDRKAEEMEVEPRFVVGAALSMDIRTWPEVESPPPCLAVTHDRLDCFHLPESERCKNCKGGE